VSRIQRVSPRPYARAPRKIAANLADCFTAGDRPSGPGRPFSRYRLA